MGLNSFSTINYGGGGSNQLNTGFQPAGVNPFPGDFLLYTIMWQAGLPVNGYVPVQPAFTVVDDVGQEWINLFDVFAVGPGGAYNSQYSMSVWYCPSAKGGPFNMATAGTAIPLLQDSQGHGDVQDWRLDNRNAITHVSKFDNSNTATPTLPAFGVKANQLCMCIFYSPFTSPTLVSSTPGYTQIQSFGDVQDFHAEYIVRPSTLAQQQPGIVVTAPIPQWLMIGLIIDISPPALNVGQIQLPDFRQMPIEE